MPKLVVNGLSAQACSRLILALKPDAPRNEEGQVAMIDTTFDALLPGSRRERCAAILWTRPDGIQLPLANYVGRGSRGMRG